ncbi:MAG: helix-turn-helix domain-containing protein [Dysgonamonadaceae bacterium]|jgi:AraC-like DNA-binding protein|nr:helix-turn-helix domain-containing protein [Dysgonamonadaceae bacterium]
MIKKNTKREIAGIDFDAVRETLSVECAGEDFIMVDDISKVPFFDYPTKVDEAVATICLKGYAEGSVDLKPCCYAANDFIIIMPGQILQYTYRSDDFSALLIVMSRRFTENIELSMKDVIPVFLYLRTNPVIHLSDAEMTHLQGYYHILKRTTQQTSNPYRMEMLRLLSQAFFYGINNFNHLREEYTIQKDKKDKLFDSFYRLILQHYKDSREVSFYAGKLCLTPKHLSVVIKKMTGKSAFEWINDYVILEAKSRLRATNMTIQQISEELNFPNQSFFGKYFKRMTGMSPKSYRGIPGG